MPGSVLFRHQAIDENGVVSGARVTFRKGRTNGVIYTDKAMRIPARNPTPANGRGVVVVYLPEGQEFEVTVTRPDGSFIEQFDSTSVTGGATIEKPTPEPAPEPQIIEKVVYRDRDVPVQVEVKVKDTEAEERLEHVLKDLERLKSEHEARKPAPATDTEPPAEVADLFDPNLTARQNQEALQKKYADTMSMREIHLANGETSEAMDLLRKAERYDSGIQWNRARLAEVV